MTIIWCMVPEIWSVMVIFFCHFGPILAFYLPNNPKNQIFEKLKKILGDIIILHMFTINDNHMMYGSWGIEHDRCNCYFSFWAIFCPITPLTTQKTKIFKKWKKYLEISSFYTYVYIKLWLDDVYFLRIGVRRTDRRTDGKVIHRGRCPT